VGGNPLSWVASNIFQPIGETLSAPFIQIHEIQQIADTYAQAGTTDPQALADFHSGLVFAEALKNRKLYVQIKKVKLLGVKDIVMKEKSVKYTDGSDKADNALRDNANTILDTTTYPDRATLKLYNGRGFDVYLRSMTLEGKRIMQYSGENGELIHDSLKRDDDIRRNGETVFEIGNPYIVDATQCANIADYWYKALGKKKHVYSLQIPGLAAWYEVGAWYNLRVGEADTNEYIDATVECYAVDCERVNGDIGSTVLLLRDVEDSWAKTTLYATRLATGGSPKRRVNRSNIVTVASSSYDGTYDYRCDGIDDDVQIQAAIDYVSNTFGGGWVQLTHGTYNLSSITLKDNITLTGVGDSTIIKADTSNVIMIDCTSYSNNKVEKLVIDCNYTNGKTWTTAINYIIKCTLGNKTIISEVEIRDRHTSAEEGYFYAIYGAGVVEKCRMTSSGGFDGCWAAFLGYCQTVSSCDVYNSNGSVYGFNYIDTISLCKVIDNITSAVSIQGFANANNISSCIVSGNIASSSIGAFSTCKRISSCESYNNEAVNYNGYVSDNNITCSSSTSNTGSSVEKGFYSCKSVQQCTTDDTTKYDESYADSGTTNACADTSAGGYNS